MEDPVVVLERNLYGHPQARTIVGTAIRESSIKIRLGKIPNWECLFVKREKRLFLSVHVDDIKLAEKKPNIDPMWKVLK